MQPSHVAAVPVVRPEVEVQVAVGMLRRDRLVERHPEARRRRQAERAVGADGRSARHRRAHVVLGEVVEALLQPHVRRRRVQMECHRRADRAVRVVQRDLRRVELGERDHLLRLEDPARMERVGLEDGDRAGLEHPRGVVARVDALARRERHPDGVRHRTQAAQVLGLDRLLEPADVEVLERARDADRGARVEPAVTLEQDLDLGAYGGANGGDERVRRRELLPRQPQPPAPERVALERAVPPLDDPRRALRERFRRSLAGVPAVRVRVDALVARAAEQPVHGLARCLPDQIPAGDLDSGERGHVHRAAAEELVAKDGRDQVLDVEWVAADEVPPRERLDVRDDGLLEVVQRRLAQPDQAVVGVDLDVDEVAPRGAEDRRADGGDPQAATRCTDATSASARRRRPSRSPPLPASPISEPPRPTASAPAPGYAAASSSVPPPVGTSGTCGSGARTAAMYDGPPASAAGNTLTALAPERHASRISDGVSAPATTGTPSSRPRAITSRQSAGEIRYVAPASTAASADAASRTVPAPSATPPGSCPAYDRSASTAPW